MISQERPVIGKDLETIRELLGVDLIDACYLFGLSMQQWSTVTGKEGDMPVKNASLAIMVRYYDKYPHRAPIPQYATPEDLVEAGLDKSLLGPIVGREVSAGQRWLNDRSSTTPPVDRLLNHLINEALPDGAIEEWKQMIVSEGRLRGNPDILKNGRWKVKN